MSKWELFFVLMMVLLLLFAVVSNVMVVIIVVSDPQMRNVPNVFICNMSISDILLAGVGLPFNLHHITHSSNFYMGNYACKLSNFMVMFTIMVSIWTLVAVSFDRHRSIVQCFKPQMTIKMAIKITATIWVLAFILATPLLYQYNQRNIWRSAPIGGMMNHLYISMTGSINHPEFPPTNHPTSQLSKTQSIQINLNKVRNSLPTQVSTITINDSFSEESSTTLLTVVNNRTGEMLMQNMHHEEASTMETSYLGHEDHSSHISCGSSHVPKIIILIDGLLRFLFAYLFPLIAISVNYSKMIFFLWKQKAKSNLQAVASHSTQVSKGKVKVMKMLCIVTILFAVSWMPFFILQLLSKLHGRDASENAGSASNLLQLFLSGFSTAYNTVFYVLYNPNFQRGFYRMFCYICPRQNGVRPQLYPVSDQLDGGASVSTTAC